MGGTKLNRGANSSRGTKLRKYGSQDVIMSDAEMNNGGPRPSVINNDDHNVSVEEIVEDNTKDIDMD